MECNYTTTKISLMVNYQMIVHIICNSCTGISCRYSHPEYKMESRWITTPYQRITFIGQLIMSHTYISVMVELHVLSVCGEPHVHFNRGWSWGCVGGWCGGGWGLGLWRNRNRMCQEPAWVAAEPAHRNPETEVPTSFKSTPTCRSLLLTFDNQSPGNSPTTHTQAPLVIILAGRSYRIQSRLAFN